jgi:hypothetical protein
MANCLSGVRVIRSLVFYVCFVYNYLSFSTFPFGHCVVCSFSIYGFRLPLWYLQTLRDLQWTIMHVSTIEQIFWYQTCFFVESHDRFWLETISTSPKGHHFSRSSRWWSVARHNFTNNLSFYMWQSSEWVLIIYHQLSIFSATCISLWREQVNFQWFDGEVHFVLD